MLTWSMRSALAGAARVRRSGAVARPWEQLFASGVLMGVLTIGTAAVGQKDAPTSKFYRISDGKVDARTYNGFRRYHAACNHCHGQDGMGSTFAPSLADTLPDIEAFRRIVRNGASSGSSVMKGFIDDPNVAPYIDDIYAYLQARADGALGRGRPEKLEP